MALPCDPHGGVAAGRSVAFRLPFATPLLNQLLRMHPMARVRHNRMVGGTVRLLSHGQLPLTPYTRALVRVVRHSTGTPDHDGMVGGMKGLLDCLLPQGTGYVQRFKGRADKWVFPHPNGCGIIADDGPHCLVVQYSAVQVKRKADQSTLVSVFDLADF